MITHSNHNFGRLIFLICLSLGLAGLGDAQPPDSPMDSGLGGGNVIEGRVILQSGQKLEKRINVRLTTMTRGDMTSMTDDNGSFAFRGLVSGNYVIIIDKEKEYEPFTQTVNIIQLRGSPSQVMTINVRLKLRASSDAKPAVLDASIASLPERGRQLYTKAEELSAAGDRKGAIEQFLILTVEYPKFMFGFNELGVQYLKLNETEKAADAFHAALKIEPEALMPLMNYGIALVSLRRFDEAEPVLQHARKIDEKQSVVRYFLGQALANLGRFDDAVKELVSAVKMGGSEMKEAHRMLAIIYSSQGKKEQAASELETYLQLAPHTPDADKLREAIQRLRGSGTQSSSSPQAKPSPQQ
jgi:predicted Zn-dependent protease